MENKAELAKLITTEQGKVLAEAVGEVAYSASFFEWFGQECRRTYGDIVPSNKPDRQLLHMREPIGVAAMITPWNFPIAMIARKAAAALACGCPCVIKPAEDTPLSALALAELTKTAGIPDGVFNVCPSDAIKTAAVGQFMCESPKISVISFTGSTDVGKLLLRQSASTVKRMCLELGGNAPFIVFASADIGEAVKGAMASKFRNSGQTCVCANRFFVHRSVFDDFVDQLTTAMRGELVVGNGCQTGVSQGPLINESAVNKVERLVDDAVKKGAKVHCGVGRHPAGKCFYKPTVLSGIDQRMDIDQEEIFGPVVAITQFESEADAVRLANSVKVGLAGYFYSRDMAQIFRVARRLEVGMVGVNTGAISTCECAFGGVKESGLGREASYLGMDEFLQTKTDYS
ncbi:unnamed protein product [Soboliphyme baturini]|uniref:Succinate-semialdehyde dehydrogenase, mitochondrial n=1 Tax=Soboliphyme baturini TaxID=241478 RepID=A0A183IZZ6_9BILA|nr:unnamed protein product [Soboliphyme baturini]